MGISRWWNPTGLRRRDFGSCRQSQQRLPHVSAAGFPDDRVQRTVGGDRKSTRLNSSHTVISYAVFCLKKKKKKKKNKNQLKQKSRRSTTHIRHSHATQIGYA